MSEISDVELEREYNGWANWETWNVALWIGGEEAIYKAAVDFMHGEGKRAERPYRAFISHIKDAGLFGVINAGRKRNDFINYNYTSTPDGALWRGKTLDYVELNDMMRNLVA